MVNVQQIQNRVENLVCGFIKYLATIRNLEKYQASPHAAIVFLMPGCLPDWKLRREIENLCDHPKTCLQEARCT